MTTPCTFNESDHPRYPHGQFAPKRNDAPEGSLSAASAVEVAATFTTDDGEGYTIERGASGFRWSWDEPGVLEAPETSDWFETEGEAIISATDDWNANGSAAPSRWAHDLLKAADAERAETDRAAAEERRERAAQLRRTSQPTPRRGKGFIAKEAGALARDAQLVGEGALADLQGYAGAVFD